MSVLQRTDLRGGPITPKGCLLGDFKSSYSLSIVFQFDIPLCDFEGNNDIYSPSFACTLLTKTSISINTPDDVQIIHDRPTPLNSPRDPKESKGCDDDVSVHDHESK